MGKSVFEQIGGTYHQQGDYLLPDLVAPENISVGVWGQRHLRYINKYRKGLYIGLQLSGELSSYLADIDQHAEDMFSQLVNQLAEQEDITEQLKADDQMEWVRQINNIRNRAEEIICRELIHI